MALTDEQKIELIKEMEEILDKATTDCRKFDPSSDGFLAFMAAMLTQMAKYLAAQPQHVATNFAESLIVATEIYRITGKAKV
jgi:hypothetical protein